ncbi:hypothetical protein CBL_08223 [Carabus blaptoides fortunei]
MEWKIRQRSGKRQSGQERSEERRGQKSRQDVRVQSLLGSVTQKKRRVKNTTKREVCEKWIRYGSDTGLSAVNFMHVSSTTFRCCVLVSVSPTLSIPVRQDSLSFWYFSQSRKFLVRQARKYMSTNAFSVY